MAKRLLGGVLLGGASRRMGTAKQLLEWRGRTLAEHAVVALAPHVEEVYLLGRGEVPEALDSLPRLADRFGVRGPLGGILASLDHEPEAGWLILGCDQPLASREAIEWLLGERRDGIWAVLPRLSEAGVEPLLAVYEPASRHLLLTAAATTGSLQGLAAHGRVATPTPPAPLRAAWRNVNTPEELEGLAAEAP